MLLLWIRGWFALLLFYRCWRLSGWHIRYYYNYTWTIDSILYITNSEGKFLNNSLRWWTLVTLIYLKLTKNEHPLKLLKKHQDTIITASKNTKIFFPQNIKKKPKKILSKSSHIPHPHPHPHPSYLRNSFKQFQQFFLTNFPILIQITLINQRTNLSSTCTFLTIIHRT